MKALLDANVLFSMLLSRSDDSPFVTIGEAIAARLFIPVVSEATLEEMSNAIRTKPYLAERISPETLDLLIGVLADSGGVVPATAAPGAPILRDVKDDYLILTARRHTVDILVSGDKDVLAHTGQEAFSILTPQAFVAALAALGA